MKKILALLLFAPLVFAASGKEFTENQLLTRAAPTSATTGMNLYQVKGFRISVCAPSGATLSGAGTIDIYNRNGTTGLWEFNKALQQTVNVTATSCSGAPCRCQVFPDFLQTARLGSQLLPAANGVTVSAGTTVDIYVQAWLVPE